MSLIKEFKLLTEDQRITDSSLYYKSDGITFTYDRLNISLDSDNFNMRQHFDMLKNNVEPDQIENTLNIINDNIEQLKDQKIDHIRKLDVIFKALLEAELIDFDNQVGKYLEQF